MFYSGAGVVNLIKSNKKFLLEKKKISSKHTMSTQHINICSYNSLLC